MFYIVWTELYTHQLYNPNFTPTTKYILSTARGFKVGGYKVPAWIFTRDSSKIDSLIPFLIFLVMLNLVKLEYRFWDLFILSSHFHRTNGKFLAGKLRFVTSVQCLVVFCAPLGEGMPPRVSFITGHGRRLSLSLLLYPVKVHLSFPTILALFAVYLIETE